MNRAVYRDRFTIPSGYVDPGESLGAALAREFEEEVGVGIHVGRLLLVRHKVVGPSESDVYFAFAVDHREGEAVARPPEIAEVRYAAVAEVEDAPWISQLSRLAIRLGAESAAGWPRSPWGGGEVPGIASETFHPTGFEELAGSISAGPRRLTRS